MTLLFFCLFDVALRLVRGRLRFKDRGLDVLFFVYGRSCPKLGVRIGPPVTMYLHIRSWISMCTYESVIVGKS